MEKFRLKNSTLRVKKQKLVTQLKQVLLILHNYMCNDIFVYIRKKSLVK